MTIFMHEYELPRLPLALILAVLMAPVAFPCDLQGDSLASETEQDTVSFSALEIDQWIVPGGLFNDPESANLEDLSWDPEIQRWTNDGRPFSGLVTARSWRLVTSEVRGDFSEVAAAQAVCRRGLVDGLLTAAQFESCIAATLMIPVDASVETVHRSTVVPEITPPSNAAQPNSFWQDAVPSSPGLRFRCINTSEPRAECRGPGPSGSDLRNAGYEAGVVRVAAYMNEGRLDGSFVTFNARGEIQKTGRISDPFPLSPAPARYTHSVRAQDVGYTGVVVDELVSDGERLVRRAKIIDGLLEGAYEIESETGRPYVRGTYISGLRDGTWERLFPDGLVRLSVNYRRGRRQGLSTLYCRAGHVLKETGLETDIILHLQEAGYESGLDLIETVEDLREAISSHPALTHALEPEGRAAVHRVLNDPTVEDLVYKCAQTSYEEDVRQHPWRTFEDRRLKTQVARQRTVLENRAIVLHRRERLSVPYSRLLDTNSRWRYLDPVGNSGTRVSADALEGDSQNRSRRALSSSDLADHRYLAASEPRALLDLLRTSLEGLGGLYRYEVLGTGPLREEAGGTRVISVDVAVFPTTGLREFLSILYGALRAYSLTPGEIEAREEAGLYVGWIHDPEHDVDFYVRNVRTMQLLVQLEKALFLKMQAQVRFARDVETAEVPDWTDLITSPARVYENSFVVVEPPGGFYWDPLDPSEVTCFTRNACDNPIRFGTQGLARVVRWNRSFAEGRPLANLRITSAVLLGEIPSGAPISSQEPTGAGHSGYLLRLRVPVSVPASVSAGDISFVVDPRRSQEQEELIQALLSAAVQTTWGAVPSRTFEPIEIQSDDDG